MQKPFDFIELLKIIVRWKKHILVACVIALVGSVIISDPHILKPYYKSTSTFYPTNPSMTSSQSMFVENQGGFFGGPDDVDRLLSIANSAQLKSYIVKKFHLFEHYKIDSARENYPNYVVQQELEDNYHAEKTDKGAIEVVVYDHDKQLASDMANDIVTKIDDINKGMLNENKKKMLSIYTNKIKLKEAEIKDISDSIIAVKQRFDLFNGVGDLRNITSLSKEQSSAFDRAAETYKMLQDKKDAAIKELNNSIVLSEQFSATISNEVPTVYLLEKAYPAERKSKPVRWIVVLSSVLIVFTVTVLTAIVVERYPKLKEAINAE